MPETIGTPTIFIFILGMHRSGTSCLAGSLERCGVFLGEVSRYNKFNVRGSHELPPLVDLHNKILQSNGGSWHDPPAEVRINPELKAEMRQFLLAFGAPSHAGMKDPRQLLMVDEWMQLTGRSQLVGTFRHPEAVAQSLARRNSNISAAKAYALWVRYNAELVRLHRQRPFPLVEFNLQDPNRYIDQVAGIAQELGLQPDFSALRRFISASLDHGAGGSSPIPLECQKLFSYLNEHAYKLTPARIHAIERARLSSDAAEKPMSFQGGSWKSRAKGQAVRLLPRPILRRGRALLRRWRTFRQDDRTSR